MISESHYILFRKHNYFYRRFNYRTNIDFDVTDNLNMRLDVSSRFMNN